MKQNNCHNERLGKHLYLVHSPVHLGLDVTSLIMQRSRLRNI